MATLPREPARPLPALRREDVVSLPRGTRLVRVYAAGRFSATWNGFRSFGPTARARFDHHPPPPGEHPDRAILYAAGDGVTALVEAFQWTRTIERDRDRPWLVVLRLARSVRLLDLRGPWPTRAGASQALSTAGEVDVTQAWARAIHADYRPVAGVLYPSAMRGSVTKEGRPAGVHPALFGANVALFERAEGAFRDRPALHLPLSHPGLGDVLGAVAERYGYEVV
jgi:hypothetical protein